MQRAASPPMDLPDVIAAAWGLSTRHWDSLLRTALLPVAAWTAASAGLYRAIPTSTEAQPLTAEQTRNALMNGAPWIVVLMLIGMVAHLALLRAVLDLLGERRPRPWGALAVALSTLPPVTAIWLGVTVGLVVALAATAALGFSPLGWVVLLGLLITRWGRRVLTGARRGLREVVYIVVGLLVIPLIVVDQRPGLLETTRRARGLVRGQAWRTLGVGLAVFVVSLLPGFVLARAGAALGSDTSVVLLGGVAMLLQAPFLAAGHAHLYLDLRARHGESPSTATRTKREAL
jgi:hypothetical protein